MDCTMEAVPVWLLFMKVLLLHSTTAALRSSPQKVKCAPAQIPRSAMFARKVSRVPTV